MNKEESNLVKDFAEAIINQVVDDDGFSECLLCNSFGVYKGGISHTDACIFHKATKYLESLESKI